MTIQSWQIDSVKSGYTTKFNPPFTLSQERHDVKYEEKKRHEHSAFCSTIVFFIHQKSRKEKIVRFIEQDLWL